MRSRSSDPLTLTGETASPSRAARRSALTFGSLPTWTLALASWPAIETTARGR